ncbi:hypothetical protein F4680DRAFT_453167 [Xylaria scruposa]|nr:hypothetical protein F4680DRAFT_453167 [Xylaria scruposa]
MSISTSRMEEAVVLWVECLNQEKIPESFTYMSSSYAENDNAFDSTTFAKFLSERGFLNALRSFDGIEVAKNMKWQWSIDSLKADYEAQCLWASLIIKGTPTEPPSSYNSAEKNISLILVKHSFFWFDDGMISKQEYVLDYEGIQAQLSEPNKSNRFDSIGSTSIPTMNLAMKLSRHELVSMYRNYLGRMNARQLDSALSGDFWHFQLFRNGKTVSLDDFREELRRFFSSFTYLNFELSVIIADEVNQRLHVQIKASAIMGGRSVKVKDHITYQYVDGKIGRIWQFFDEVDLKEQLSAMEKTTRTKCI